MIDSRAVEPGDLFVGLPGERADGGAFAAGGAGGGRLGRAGGAGVGARRLGGGRGDRRGASRVAALGALARGLAARRSAPT